MPGSMDTLSGRCSSLAVASCTYEADGEGGDQSGADHDGGNEPPARDEEGDHEHAHEEQGGAKVIKESKTILHRKHLLLGRVFDLAVRRGERHAGAYLGNRKRSRKSKRNLKAGKQFFFEDDHRDSEIEKTKKLEFWRQNL